MAKKRLNIRRSIERLLIPELEARGFVRQPPEYPDNFLPYGEFVREGPHGKDLVEIQFDHYWPATFRINVGMTNLKGERDERHCHVTRWGLPLRRWFGVRKLAREGITEAEYDAAVDVAVRCIPEIERYLASGATSWRLSPVPEPRWVIWCLLCFWLLVVACGYVGSMLAVRLLIGAGHSGCEC